LLARLITDTPACIAAANFMLAGVLMTNVVRRTSDADVEKPAIFLSILFRRPRERACARWCLHVPTAAAAEKTRTRLGGAEVL
jgi:hypothetical protein